MKTRLSVMVCIALSSSLSYADWTSSEEISLLKAQGNGMYFEIENFTSADSAFNCGSKGFWLSESATNYQARVSMLIAAYMSQTAIKVGYNGCSSGSNETGSILFQ